MRKSNGVLAAALVVAAIGIGDAGAADMSRLAAGRAIIVPDCIQNRLEVGLACAPRAALPVYDRAAIEDVVDLDRHRIVRPYANLFSWGP